ncbi:MAG: sensor histidine kinase [Candidatus Zhuqueibacterota bacterium]
MSYLYSLKTRFVLLMGSLIIFLMMAISISVLIHWRSLILKNQAESALLVTQTFSVSILDALIYQESGLLQQEGFLENHIHNFLKKNEQVKFIHVYDPHGHIMVRSSYSGASQIADGTGALASSGNFEPICRIHNIADFGWITEVTFPLQIHGKSWGVLKMGFDSEPTRAKMKQLFFLLLTLTLSVVVIILAVIYVLIHRLTKSLRQLVSEMNQLDLERDGPIQLTAGRDEIGFLVTNFEEMKKRLAQSRRQLLEAQRQVFHAEKLASVGRLASGVAHEINNPLNGIKNCLYAIGREPEDLGQTHRYLQLANEGLDHIALIVQKLLGFSRQQSKHVARINLNDEIDNVLSLIQYRLEKNNIHIRKQLADELPAIQADGHLIQEVIMNLLINSIDSIEVQGQITIATGVLNSDAIFFEISDNGTGIEPQHLDKIFDPFFTTKDEGKGTGLGLSVSLGIIENHAGAIRVSSQPGVKTTFHVTLPIQGAA